MKHWRKLAIFALILAMPISSWSSVMMASHCHTSNNTSHSAHTQMDASESMHAHMQDQAASQDTSDHAGCECGCDSEINCSVSGCSATTLLNSIEMHTINSTQFMHQAVAALAVSPYPNLLSRPPISLS